MGWFWFLVFIAQLAVASALVQFQENEFQHKHPGMQLSVFPVWGYHSPLSSSSQNESEFSDLLARDNERAKALHSRLSKVDFSSHIDSASASISSRKEGKPKSVRVPLKSGLSLGSGNYYVRIGLGTPAKYFSMLFDTGSSFSWLQCQPCVMYCHPQLDPAFNPSSSKSYKSLTCSSAWCSSLKDATLNDPICEKASGSCIYKASYGDSSYSLGYLSQDTLTLTASETLQSFVYGCGQNNEGLFGKTAGVIGLARDKFSMISQLFPKHGYAFSYCLPTASSVSGNSSNGGFLSIGNSSMAVSSSSQSYKFTPMIKDSKNPSLYLLNLTTIKVAGRTLEVAASHYKVPTIIDSGTVITRLPMAVYAVLRKAFLSTVSKKFKRVPRYAILDTCFNSVNRMVPTVPEIEMKFQGGASLLLRASNVLIEVEKGVTCLAFAGSYGSDPIAIIGNYQQQTFNVAYDVSKSRIGFAAGGCH